LQYVKLQYYLYENKNSKKACQISPAGSQLTYL
jgi:hypothetical protein